MFKPLDHIECCNNAGAPGLVVGSAYGVEYIVSHWWIRLIYGRDVWGVKLYGHPLPYHHSYFRPVTRRLRKTDFNMQNAPFRR